MKSTVLTLQKQKEEGNKITMLTAYDYSVAKLIDAAGIDIILGYEDTLPVTMEDMIHHTACVSRGAKDAFVIADMPFMSYQTSVRDAVYNAGRLIKEGHAHAIKLEGGASVCEQIKAITEASIPVCAHIGLTPQSTNAFGGFKVQGKSMQRAKQIVEDALSVQEAGAFMVTLECIPEKLASLITDILDIPTIGIGAGNGCDGQVLVYHDMLGMFTDLKPKFVKHFGNIGEEMTKAFVSYRDEVKSKAYPATEHTFKIEDEIMEELYKEYR